MNKTENNIWKDLQSKWKMFYYFLFIYAFFNQT